MRSARRAATSARSPTKTARKTRTCRGTGSNGWQGFGYVVNHYANGASLTRGVAGQTTTVLEGKHHSVHQFKWRVSPGGPVDVTVEWRVSTGRSHPIFAVTFDSGPSGANKTNADARAPYGDMAFEGGAAGPISGVGWGDSHKFTTKGSGPVTATTPWDYTQPNTTPYDLSWSNAADAEMGLVATHTFQSGPSAGDYGGGALSQRWGKSGSSLLADIPDWTWPYQLNQYELPFGTTSHRVAWGASYGAVGQSSYTSFGRTLSGFPYTSYALSVVFGTHGESAVMAEVADMEAVTKTTISTTKGTVSTSGAGGPGQLGHGPVRARRMGRGPRCVVGPGGAERGLDPARCVRRHAGQSAPRGARLERWRAEAHVERGAARSRRALLRDGGRAAQGAVDHPRLPRHEGRARRRPLSAAALPATMAT